MKTCQKRSGSELAAITRQMRCEVFGRRQKVSGEITGGKKHFMDGRNEHNSKLTTCLYNYSDEKRTILQIRTHKDNVHECLLVFLIYSKQLQHTIYLSIGIKRKTFV